jgi:3-oxoacyl-[acyl-carrier-protein] synthase-3
MSTDSEILLEKGVETAARCWENFLREMDWDADSIDSFFCHQVGRAHARLLFNRLGLDIKKNFETLVHLGNIGSVSVPITMAMGIEENILSAGERGALLGIGSGINSMMLGIDW